MFFLNKGFYLPPRVKLKSDQSLSTYEPFQKSKIQMQSLRNYILLIYIFISLHMNDSKDAIIRNLQEKIQQKDNACRELRNRLAIEKGECRQLRETCKFLQTQSTDLQSNCNDLQNQLKNAQEQNAKFQVKSHYKSYNELTSYSMRRKRKSIYRKLISNVLSSIKDIRRARVTLNFGKRHISLSWSENEIRKWHGLPPVQHSNALHSHVTQGNTVTLNDNGNNNFNAQEDDNLSGISEIENNDEGFCGSQNVPSEIDGDSDIDPEDDEVVDNNLDYEEKEVFDEDGKWNNTLLREIINVMDKHKISHTAYHELKMTLPQGFNPPINQIKSEKKKMLHEIPFTRHPSVSLLVLHQHEVAVICKYFSVYFK